MIQLQSIQKITNQRGEYSFARVFGSEPIKSAEELSDYLEYDIMLFIKRLGHSYLCILKRLDKYNEHLQNMVIGFDPGVITFSTGYDPDGIIIELEKPDISGIHRLCRSIDKLQSTWLQLEINHRQGSRYKKVGARTQSHIQNLVNETCKRVTKCTCEIYNTIV